MTRRELSSLRDISSPNLLRVAIDAWPGYFPLFAIEGQLRRQNNIVLATIESSTEKMRLLREGHIDVVATTPGCLLGGRNVPDIADLRLLAVLNVSCGADKVLIAGSRPRNRGSLPTADELTCATWIVTSGSTSELLARAFAANCGVRVPRDRWLRVGGYHEALDAVRAAKGIAICSTWEPYATWICDAAPNATIALTTRECPPLVADYLVCLKNASRELINRRTMVLLNEWDASLREKSFGSKNAIKTVCWRFHDMISESDYQRMIDGVHLLTTREAQLMARQGLLLDMFKRVWKVWNRPQFGDAEAVWNRLVSPPGPGLSNTGP